MPERSGREPAAPTGDSGTGAVHRFGRLLQSVGDLARSDTPDALAELLRETDRLIVRERECIGRDPAAATRLLAMQARILEAGEALAVEQRRIVRDLAALQALAQARNAPPRSVALDRRG